jgi:menaquinone-dependent protoporphyrinogen IX oxidase
MASQEIGGSSAVEGRTLLAYVSAGGATEYYAGVVAEVLRSRGYVVDLVNLRRDKVPDLSSYENAVLGTGVRMGMVYRKGKQFLRRSDLKGRPLGVFLSSGMAVEDPKGAKEKFLTPIVDKYGLVPTMYDAFPGKMPGSGGKLEDRTDPEVARRWAEELGDRLGKTA